MSIPHAVDTNFMYRLEKIAKEFIRRPPENDYQRGAVRMLYDVMLAATNGESTDTVRALYDAAVGVHPDFSRPHQLAGRRI